MRLGCGPQQGPASALPAGQVPSGPGGVLLHRGHRHRRGLLRPGGGDLPVGGLAGRDHRGPGTAQPRQRVRPGGEMRGVPVGAVLY